MENYVQLPEKLKIKILENVEISLDTEDFIGYTISVTKKKYPLLTYEASVAGIG